MCQLHSRRMCLFNLLATILMNIANPKLATTYTRMEQTVRLVSFHTLHMYDLILRLRPLFEAFSFTKRPIIMNIANPMERLILHPAKCVKRKVTSHRCHQLKRCVIIMFYRRFFFVFVILDRFVSKHRFSRR